MPADSDRTISPRVAVIGCGYWGKNLVRNYASLNALSALVDHHQENIGALRAQFGGEEKSFEEVLADKSIDGVVIATPSAGHFDLALAALNAGKHVFIEKPMTLSLATAEALAKRADETKRILMIGHVLHYHAAFAKLKELAQAGGLGRIRHIVSTRFNLGKILDDEDVLWALAPHDISMIIALLGPRPAQVTAQGSSFLRPGILDIATLRLEYEDGASAEIRLSWMHPVKEHKLTVIGDKAMAIFDDTLPWDSKLTLYRPALDWENPAVIPTAGIPEKIAIAQNEPLRNECAHFLECMATGRRPVTDHQEGVAVTRIIEQASVKLAGKSRLVQNNRRRATS